MNTKKLVLIISGAYILYSNIIYAQDDNSFKKPTNSYDAKSVNHDNSFSGKPLNRDNNKQDSEIVTPIYRRKVNLDQKEKKQFTEPDSIIYQSPDQKRIYRPRNNSSDN
jgi:hypothetical protein